MPLPSFTTPPQWLETPMAYPLLQFNTWGVMGPYPFGGKLFWFATEATAAVSASIDLVAYSNTSATAAQPSTRVPPASPISIVQGIGSSVFYPGSGSLVYIAYVDTSISAFFGVIQLIMFDMSTSTWGTPNSTGVTINGGTSKIGIGTLTVFKLANGNVQIVFDAIATGGLTGQLYTSIFNGVSWTTTQLSSGVSSFWKTVTATAISSSKIGLWYYDDSVDDNIYYSVVNGSSFASTATVTTFNHLQISQPITAMYDPVSDTAAALVIQNHFEFVNLLLASPSASTTTSVVTVYDDAAAAFEYSTGAIAGNSAGNQFYVLLWDSIDNVLHIFGSTALATGWTVSPSVFYSQALHPPISPAPAGPEIFPIYATFLNGTTYSVTAGFLAAVGGDPAFCGVMAAMIPPVITQTLQLIKQVSGGSAVATDWTLSAAGPTPISGAGGVGPSNVDAGTYTLTETAVTDYTLEALICVGGTQVGNQVTLAAGQSAVCTFTNLFTGVTPPPPPPPFCVPFEPTTPSPSLVAYDEPLELKGS